VHVFLTTELAIICSRLLAGDRRALARAITLAEGRGAAANELSKRLFAHAGRAHLVGVTGSPGVGKSTIVDRLIGFIRQDRLSVAVLAVDPSSPFSGGAILGDRIRMQRHTLDPGVFIRSMANRGHYGGVALATYDAVRILEAFGFDLILIETLGVGQSELAVAQTADTTILALMPGSGDDVQAIKSGIMEIGDIFVVNKGDLPGASKTAAEVSQNLELTAFKTAWRPPVLIAKAGKAEIGQPQKSADGVEELWQAIKAHKRFLDDSGFLRSKRTDKTTAELAEIISARARTNFARAVETSEAVKAIVARVVDLRLDPYSAVQILPLDSLFGDQS
jgi:LAO/AO transport system kinase